MSASGAENALRNVSMFFRSEPKWSVVEPLRGMGWRLRKQYYLIASKTDTKMPKHLLSWVSCGASLPVRRSCHAVPVRSPTV